MLILSMIFSIVLYYILIYNYKNRTIISKINVKISAVFSAFLLITMLSGTVYLLPLLDIGDIPHIALSCLFDKLSVDKSIQSSIIKALCVIKPLVSVLFPLIAIYFSKQVYDYIVIDNKVSVEMEAKEIIASYAITMTIAFVSISIFQINHISESDLTVYTLSPICLLLSTFVPLEVVFSKKNAMKEMCDLIYDIFFGCRKVWLFLSLIFSVVFAILFNCAERINDSVLLNFLIGFNIPPLLIIAIKSILKHKRKHRIR